MKLTAEDIVWEEAVDGDPSYLLLSQPRLSFAGVQMHVCAIQVEEDENTFIQTGVTDELEHMLDLLASAFSPDGGWTTIEIDGRDYVVFAEPYSR